MTSYTRIDLDAHISDRLGHLLELPLVGSVLQLYGVKRCHIGKGIFAGE